AAVPFLPPFPPLRSSYLIGLSLLLLALLALLALLGQEPAGLLGGGRAAEADADQVPELRVEVVPGLRPQQRGGVEPPAPPDHARSEEHTSELQSPYDLVC